MDFMARALLPSVRRSPSSESESGMSSSFLSTPRIDRRFRNDGPFLVDTASSAQSATSLAPSCRHTHLRSLLTSIAPLGGLAGTSQRLSDGGLSGLVGLSRRCAMEGLAVLLARR